MDRCDEVAALYRTRYAGFTARHFHEHLVRDHRFPVLELQLDQGVFAKLRPVGEVCTAWGAPAQAPAPAAAGDDVAPGWLAPHLAAAGPALDLITIMDNATNEVYALILVDEEGTAST